MELRSLRVFVEVVRHGGFSAAAKVVHATQSTVSKSVKQLEDEFGVQLLDRIGHRNVLTSAGEIAYKHAINMLAQRDELLTELGDVRRLKSGHIRLGFPPLDVIAYAPLFAAFRDLYPQVEVRIFERSAKGLEDSLLAGEFDLVASLLPVSSQFEYQDVGPAPLMVLMRKDSQTPKVARTNIRLLESFPIILFSEGYAVNDLVLGAYKRRGIAPKIIAGTGQIDFMLQLVVAGAGIAFLPRFIAEQHKHPGIVQMQLDEPETELHRVFLWRRGAYVSDAARAWLALAATRDRTS